MPPIALLKPEQVAKSFENTFWDRKYISPDEVGLDKKLADIGLDSFDCLEIITDFEQEFGIKMSYSPTYASLYDLLGACVQTLVSAKRLTADDGMLVKTQYTRLLRPVVQQHNQKTPGTTQALSEEYVHAITQNKTRVPNLKQHQK